MKPRAKKIAWIAAGSVVGLIAVLMMAAIIVVQTQWFRDFVRTKIVSSVEDATGGTATIGSFSFDWHQLRAEVRDLVVHGLEPANAQPLLQAKLLEVDLKLLSPAKGFVDIAALLVDTPQANVMVFPDGRTNIPPPKTKPSSNQSGLETVVNLAIGHFDLRNGSLTFADRKANFSAAGENLRAQLEWQTATGRYTGEIDVSPLDWRPAGGEPMRADLRVPVTLEKDRISFANARLAAGESAIVFNGSMEHMLAPVYRGRLNARVALDELKRAAQLTTPLDTVRGPRFVNLDVAATADANRIDIQSARLNLGQSTFEAAGELQGEIRFRANLVMREIGRLLRLTALPEGTAHIAGNAAMSPHRIDVTGFHLAALGSELDGSASLVDQAQLHFAGSLRNFDIAALARAAGNQIGYRGVVSGPLEADGNIKTPASLAAKAKLVIAPGSSSRGIPVSGRLNAGYNGQTGAVTLDQSYLALPHTRIDLSGSLGQQIQVRMVSRDFADFRPIAVIPVTFNNGNATVDATVRGTLSSPKIMGHAAMSNFAVDGRPFTRFAADWNASRAGAAVSNASLARGNFEAEFAASAGLRNWKPESSQPLRVDATVRNGDLRDALAIAGQSSVNAAGALSADAHIAGTIGDPRGNADFTIINGSVNANPLDRVSARVLLTSGAIEVPTFELVSGASRLEANATYQHAANDLERGSLRAHVASSQVQLAEIPSLLKERPGLRGTVSLNGDLAAEMTPAVEIRSVAANLAARGLEMQGRKLGDVTATANTSGNAIQYNVSSDFAGSTIRVAGQSLLTGDHQTTASGSVANLPLDQVLAVAGRRDLAVSGVLNANAQVSGTLNKPEAHASFVVNKGSAYREPFDRLQATVNYNSQLIDVPSFHLTAGPSDLDLSLSFAHPAGNLADGQVRFRVRSNSLQLARFRTLEQYRPGLAGTLQLTADGAATLRRNQVPLFSTLNADLAARGLSMNKKPLGDVTANAETRGSAVTFRLNSDFAHANIAGEGRMDLGGDYPLNASLRFSNVTYAGVSAFTGSAGPAGLEASTDGQLTLAGPMARTQDLRGALEFTKLEAHSRAAAQRGRKQINLDLHNQGPVVIGLDASTVTIRSAHIIGTDTDLSLSGTAALAGSRAMNVRANGNVRLELLEAFSPDIFSSGSVILNAAVTGTTAEPMVNGRLEFENAALHLTGAPNGITNANGAIAFNGTEAVLQNITGETGGGKVTLSGSVVYAAQQLQFRLQASANRVYVAYPDNATTEANARLTLTGNSTRSILGGNVTILNVALRRESDIGSMLSQAATPPAAPTETIGVLGGLTFDVRIQTAPDAQFRTSLTQNLAADADLTLRGTIDHPGMLGRITITQGQVVFFGSKYTISQGAIAFYDPNKINPRLNIDLQTTTQGVEVSLNVSGPLDRMKLSYRSEPPLRFDEIVALLATGKAPTTDPVLAAYQPAAPQQNFQQQGLSTLLGQGVANPVAGHLQRLFGVSKLSINPMITGASNTPQATLTLQQQITQTITFTYIQDVAATNPQTIRMEWAINPRWSAIAQRDIYGELGLNFFYKKRFH